MTRNSQEWQGTANNDKGQVNNVNKQPTKEKYS